MEFDYSQGYLEGKQKKMISQPDLKAMYKFYHGKAQISLWCDGKESTDSKSSTDDQSTPQ